MAIDPVNKKNVPCLYIHICKCAGTSILNTLRKTKASLWEPEENINTGEWKKYNTFSIEGIKNHYPATSARKHLGNEQFSRLFKFTIVRNPWSRLVSSYYFRLEKNEWKNQMTFSDYVRNLGRNIEYGKYIVHSLNCLDWITDADGNLLVDFIGRFENLQSDFQTLCEQLKIEQEPLLHVNRTNHKHYTEYFDRETRDIVSRRYERDIEFFGYEFGD